MFSVINLLPICIQFVYERVTLNDLLHNMTRQDLSDMNLRYVKKEFR